MIEQAIRALNTSNEGNRWIATAFAKCGFNPFCKDTVRFEAHIAELKSCPFYKTNPIVPCNEVLTLEKAGLTDEW